MIPHMQVCELLQKVHINRMVGREKCIEVEFGFV